MNKHIETVRAAGFSMDCLRFGDGEKALVVLPGLSIQSVMRLAFSVQREYEVMTKDFTVYLFDRRMELPANYTVRDMAEDTVAAVRALGLSDICLYGVSQGGMMAQTIAIEHPELVKKLVLGSTAARENAQARRVLEHWIHLAEQRDGPGLYLDSGSKIYSPEGFEKIRDIMKKVGRTVTEEEFCRFITLARAIHGFDVTAELKKVQCPVLVIGARDDAVLGATAAEELWEALPDSIDKQIYIYDGYGHVAFDTAPDYRQRVYEFFHSGTVPD